MKRRVAVMVIGILIAIGGAGGESQEAELKAGATLGGNAQKSSLYPPIETFPTIVDARHANTEAVDLFTRFFATKSRHDRTFRTPLEPLDSILVIF